MIPLHRSALLSVGMIVAAGCASSAGGQRTNGDASPQATGGLSGDSEDSLPPPGYGTLRQDDFTLAFSSSGVQIKATPLAESVIRLAAPDTYQRLHAMVESRRERMQRVQLRYSLRRAPLLFLVSFFTFERQASFVPTDLQILSQGSLYRPLEILPLTPGWGQQQLKQEDTQAAIYMFSSDIHLDVNFQIEYRGAVTSAWGRLIHLLEAERGRVLSRSKS